MTVIALTFILFTLGLTMTAAVTDFMRLKIPNLYPSLVFGLFGVVAAMNQFTAVTLFENIINNLVVGIIALVVMIACFFMRVLGGGDAKLIAALSFWVGTQGLPVFLMVMTIVGGLLAIISIAMRKTSLGQTILTKLATHPNVQQGWVGAMNEQKNVVPYGIAIAVGAVFAFCDVGLLP